MLADGQGAGRPGKKLSPRGRATRLTLAVAAALAFGMGGCGEEPPAPTEAGTMADSVPADASVYGEVVVRPSGELSGRVDDAIELFGFDPGEERGKLGDEIAARVSEELELGSDLSYEEDIQPWLGYRAAGFATLASSRELREARLPGGGIGAEAGEAAAIVEVTDTEAAKEALEKALGASDGDGDEEAVYVHEGDPEVVLLEDRLLIGDPTAVADARDASEGSSSLAEQEWFLSGMGDVGEEASLGFVMVPGSDAFKVGLVQALPGFAAYSDRLSEIFDLLDPEEPLSVEVNLLPEGVALDNGYGLRERARISQAEEQFGALPADAWLAAASPILPSLYIDSSMLGLQIGFEKEGVGYLELVRKFGYDPIASLDRLNGEGAVFATGSVPGSDLTGGVMLGVDAGDEPPFAVDAARFLIGTHPGATISKRPVHFGGPFAFSATLRSLEGRIVATEFRRRLGVIAGPQKLDPRDVFLPERTIAGSDRLEGIGRALGSGWTPLGFAHLERLVTVASLVDPSLAAVVEAEDVPEGSRLLLGAKDDEGRLNERLLLDAP